MLKNILGHIVEHEQSIIPLISFNKTTGRFRCIGTAFFINSAGLFITAKHVLFDNNDKMFEMIMGIQTLSNKKSVSREISHLSIHPLADIVLGRLGNVARDGKANKVMYEPTPPFILSFKKLDTNDNIMAFGYPIVDKEVIGTETTFKFTGLWTEGLVKDFCPDGSPLLNNSRCYQTNLVQVVDLYLKIISLLE